MKWLCKVFGHRFTVSTASVSFDDKGHFYVRSCSCGEGGKVYWKYFS